MFRSIGKKTNGIVKVLQKSLSFRKKSSSDHSEEEVGDSSSYVPEDVKEGHIAVIAIDGDGPKRFIIPISYLSHPVFLRLLEQAAEEYGFDHEGALTIPCRPSELQRMFG